MIALSLSLISLMTTAPSLGAHVHGEAHLALAMDANGHLEVHFQAPKHDVLGFEHAPETAEEQAAIDRLNTAARNLETFLTLSGGRCQLSDVHLGEVSDIHAASQPHPDHTHDHDHSDEHAHEHEHTDDHDHAHSSDFSVEYSLECGQPDRLQSLTFTGFDAFPSLTSVEVTWLSESAADIQTLTPQRAQMRF